MHAFKNKELYIVKQRVVELSTLSSQVAPQIVMTTALGLQCSHVIHTAVFQMYQDFPFPSVNQTVHKRVNSGLTGPACHTPAFPSSTWTIWSLRNELVYKRSTDRHWKYIMYAHMLLALEVPREFARSGQSFWMPECCQYPSCHSSAILSDVQTYWFANL